MGHEKSKIYLNPDYLSSVILSFYKIPSFSLEEVQEIRDYVGLSPRSCPGSEVAFLVRKLADKRCSNLRKFMKSLVPGLKVTSKKSYYVNHLSYRYGSAIGYYQYSKGLKNWRNFLLTPIENLRDPYSTLVKDKDEKRTKKVKKKRVSIYSVMEEFFIKGGSAKDCLFLLADLFPEKSNRDLKKTMKVYLYKFKKQYNISKKEKTIQFIPKE